MSHGDKDFDFLLGTWSVANRRLVTVLAGGTEWDEFPGVLTCRPVFAGAGQFEEASFPTKGFGGLTLRLFDPERAQWSLYWVSSRSTVIDPPVVGRFVDGVGEFFADDTYGGVPIRCRYRWSEITLTSARWEQAFSTDGERTWETNWIMAFTRTKSP